MKKLLTLMFVLLLAACAPGNKESALQDSSSMNDTLPESLSEPTLVDDASTLSESGSGQEQTSDTSQLEITFDETAGLVFEKQEPYSTVSIVTKQYEASAHVTWYFDAGISPIYFKESWASEGNEGSTEFFIEAGSVMCAATQESVDEKKWCRKTGGLRIYDGGSGDLLTELLPSEYGKTVDDELTRYLDILKALLKDAEITEQDADSYTLRIENTVNYGQEYTESTEVRIPKKVYEGVK